MERYFTKGMVGQALFNYQMQIMQYSTAIYKKGCNTEHHRMFE